MYAIVEIAGKQYKVQEDEKLFVPLLDAKVDDTIEFDRVLLYANEGDVRIGAPIIDGATVSAKVLEHVKADKVLVFRKIRRKRFKVTKGHRQQYTRIEVGDVSVNGGAKKKSDSKKKSGSAAASTAKADEPKKTAAQAADAAAPEAAKKSAKKATKAEPKKEQTSEANAPKEPTSKAERDETSEG